MGGKLASSVILPGLPGSGGAPFVIYGPDDDVPDEHARMIGAHAWEGGVHPLDDEDGPFDPSEHTVAEVQEYLETADDAEQKRVLKAEKAGKARTTLLGD